MAVHEQSTNEKVEARGVLDTMQVLEQKIAQLIEMIRCEKKLNAALLEEQELLRAKLEMAENSLLKESCSNEEFNQERELTRRAVDELISSIDSLISTMPSVTDADSKGLELE